MVKMLDFLASLPGIVFTWQGLFWTGIVFLSLFALLLIFGIFHWPNQEKLTLRLAGQYSATAAMLAAMIIAALGMSFCFTYLFAAFWGCVAVIFTSDARTCLRVGMACGMLTWVAIPLAVIAFANLVNADLTKADS